MTKIHVLADETLGGTLREYVEVDRKAEVGDYVFIEEYAEVQISDVVKIIRIDEYGDLVTENCDYYLDNWDIYRVLDPTDIVHIDGSRFRLVDRKAEVGERVIVVNEAYPDSFDETKYRNGYVFEAKNVDSDDILALKGTDTRLYHTEYRVLEPVETSPQNTDDRDTLSLIANLARRVAELERRDEAQRKLNGKHSERFAEHSSLIYGAKRDVETWAQEVEGLRNDLAGYRSAVEDVDAKVEMCIDDIVTLDERTSESKNVAKSTVKVCDFSIRQSIDGETNVDVTFSGAPSAGNIAEAIRQALGGVRE